jgi:hypothetical protein
MKRRRVRIERERFGLEYVVVVVVLQLEAIERGE